MLFLESSILICNPPPAPPGGLTKLHGSKVPPTPIKNRHFSEILVVRFKKKYQWRSGTVVLFDFLQKWPTPHVNQEHVTPIIFMLLSFYMVRIWVVQVIFILRLTTVSALVSGIEHLYIYTPIEMRVFAGYRVPGYRAPEKHKHALR